MPLIPLLMLLLLAGLPLLPAAVAAEVKAAPARPAKKPPAVPRAKPAPAAPVAPAVVSANGAGQSGYVHYWLITAPDGEQETQVGIELPDQRIAWSFPGLGVHVAAFIGDGEVDAHGKIFRVRHLYGLRPFASDTAMRTLRSSLMARLRPLLQQRVPYCELNGVTPGLCMSCMGLVSQILFPGRTPEYASFPRNFTRVSGDDYHTTEDLLLYLTGLHALRTDVARRQRMEALGGPPALREELERLSELLAAQQAVATAATTEIRPVPKSRARPAPKSAIKPPARRAPAG